MTRNRILALITLLGGVGATVIVAGTGRSYSSAPAARGSAVTVTSYARVGPTASCNGTRCQAGLPAGPSLQVPAGGSSYTAIVTVSMQYDTSARGTFTFHASAWTPNDHPHGHLLPMGRRLLPSASPESATLVYRVSHLVPGQHYTFRYGPDIRTNATGHRRMTTHHVLVVVTAMPTRKS